MPFGLAPPWKYPPDVAVYRGTPLSDALRHEMTDVEAYLRSKGGMSREVYEDEKPSQPLPLPGDL